jgi:hypothetical protein
MGKPEEEERKEEIRLFPLPLFLFLLPFPTFFPLTSALCRSTVSSRPSHNVGPDLPFYIGISVSLISPRNMFLLL